MKTVFRYQANCSFSNYKANRVALFRRTKLKFVFRPCDGSV